MEALLEKERDVENWNDDRLDELSRRMDNGFKEMREGFAGVNDRIDRLFYLQILFLVSLSVAVISHAV